MSSKKSMYYTWMPQDHFGWLTHDESQDTFQLTMHKTKRKAERYNAFVMAFFGGEIVGIRIRRLKLGKRK